MLNSNIKYMKTLKNYFTIGWHPTFWCNYHCPYCVQNDIKDKFVPENILIEHAKKINYLIENKIDKKFKIIFRLIGGEISVYNWPLILNEIKKINEICFVTNFSASIDYYKELYLYCNKRKINLILLCSKHAENKEYDSKIINLIEWCKSKNFNVPSVRLLVDNDFNISKYNNYKNKGINPNLTIIRGSNNKLVKLNSEIRTFMENYQKNNKKYNFGKFEVQLEDGSIFKVPSGVQLTNRYEYGIDPTNYYCSCGINTLFIRPNGDIVASECKYLRDKVLGNLEEVDKFNISNKHILCKVNEGVPEENYYYCTLCWGCNLYKELDDENFKI